MCATCFSPRSIQEHNAATIRFLTRRQGSTEEAFIAFQDGSSSDHYLLMAVQSSVPVLCHVHCMRQRRRTGSPTVFTSAYVISIVVNWACRAAPANPFLLPAYSHPEHCAAACLNARFAAIDNAHAFFSDVGWRSGQLQNSHSAMTFTAFLTYSAL